MISKDIKKPIISALVILGVSRLFDIINIALERNDDNKEKRIGLELILAVILIMIIKNLY